MKAKIDKVYYGNANVYVTHHSMPTQHRAKLVCILRAHTNITLEMDWITNES